MSNPVECRKFRANLRNGIDLNKVKEHIATCPECRKAIQETINKNPNSSYKGNTIEQVLENAQPVKRVNPYQWW
jgi:hypothetical protein